MDGNVVAAVWNEGTYSGDTYFLFENMERAEDVELLEDMIKFSKTFAAGLKEDRRTRTLNIFVPEWHDTLRKTVLKHGFQLENGEETYKRIGFEKRGCNMRYHWEAEIFISWEKESLEHDYEKEFILSLQ